MISRDTGPILLRIAKLEELLKDRERKKSQAKFFADPSKLISIAAFIISIGTTIYSFRKDALEQQAAARRDLDNTIQQTIDANLRSYELKAKNRTDPNFGALAGWFATQAGLLTNRAAADLDRLKSATTIDYLTVGNALANTGDFSGASRLYVKAIDLNSQTVAANNSIAGRSYGYVASFFSADQNAGTYRVLKAHDLASAHMSLGSSLYGERKTADADGHFEAALLAIENSDYPDSIKAYQKAWTHKTWAEASMQVDCRLSQKHIQQASNLFPADKRFTDNPEWTFIQYEVSWLTANCDPTGHIQGNWSPLMQQSIAPATTLSFPGTATR